MSATPAVSPYDVSGHVPAVDQCAAPEGEGGQGGALGGILGERWPALGRALRQYAQGTAEAFSQRAYEAVEGGLIRHTDRQRLAVYAEELGIRSFDAQLLIACAVRQWALDHAYDASPTPSAPRLSFEYRSWRRVWVRIGLVLGTAVALDGIILWKWLS